MSKMFQLMIAIAALTLAGTASAGAAVVRDHRTPETPVVRDHRTPKAPIVRDHRTGGIKVTVNVGAGVKAVKKLLAGKAKVTINVGLGVKVAKKVVAGVAKKVGKVLGGLFG